MITVKVSCPVCAEALPYEHHEAEAWGMIPLLDLGCAEITIIDRTDAVRSHLAVHYADGTWLAKYEERLRFEQRRAEQYFHAKESAQ